MNIPATLIVFWLVCGVAAAAIASAKNSSGLGWQLVIGREIRVEAIGQPITRSIYD
jgi:hypothetical protein